MMVVASAMASTPAPLLLPDEPVYWARNKRRRRVGGHDTTASRRNSPRFTKGGRKLKRKKQSR